MTNPPIIQAVIKRDYCRLNKLLEEITEAELNAVDNDGMSALHHAARTGFCLRALLNSKININATDNSGNTALMLACCEGLCAVVKSLCEAGADTNISNQFGKSPLNILSMKGHVECLEIIINHGADISSLSPSDVNTALEYERTGAVIYLLKLISDYEKLSPSSQQDCTQHPFHTALKLGNEECIDAMLSMGCILVNQETLDIIEKETSSKLSESSMRHLRAVLEAPINLKSLCRLQVRKCMKELILPDMCRQLPIPNKLQSYVAMEDYETQSSRKHAYQKMQAIEN